MQKYSAGGASAGCSAVYSGFSVFYTGGGIDLFYDAGSLLRGSPMVRLRRRAAGVYLDALALQRTFFQTAGALDR